MHAVSTNQIADILHFNDNLIYYIGYVTIKDSKYVKINSVSPFYFIINKMNGFFEKQVLNASSY